MLQYKFDVEKTTKELIQWIKDWFSNNGNNCNAVVGISGGKDSSVVAALCVEALGKDRVIGVLMPQGTQFDIQYSLDLCNHLDIKRVEVNIGKTVQDICDAINTGVKRNSDMYRLTDDEHYKFSFNISEQTAINLPARIRMATLYAVSQSVNGRVANTCNLSEDWVGYATRYGDGAGDFSPLSMLTTEEIISIGDYLGIPYLLTHKVPIDGLCGKTDEENLGFTYKVLNRYIRLGDIEDESVKEKIDEMHKKNIFKLLPMPKYTPDLPIVVAVE